MKNYVKYNKCKYCRAVLLYRNNKNYHQIIEPERVGECTGLKEMGINPTDPKTKGEFFTTKRRGGLHNAFYLEI